MSTRDRMEALKDLIKEIHDGTPIDQLKQQFKETLPDTTPSDIGKAEDELVKEGMPREELRRLCDVHLEVMRDSLATEQPQLQPGHPVHTFMEEHQRILEFLAKLQDTVQEIKTDPASLTEKKSFLLHLAEHLMEIEGHNAREENVLFPYMEKHGITEPPAVMWAEHSDLREIKKQLLELVQTGDQMAVEDYIQRLENLSNRLNDALAGHIYKENNILYPMALQAVTEPEWQKIRQECDALGYCCFTPESAQMTEPGENAPGERVNGVDGLIHFPTGSLTTEELLGILNSLPVDLTFVDRNNVFRYFNEALDRHFPRSVASIGRTVQQCHPEKSLHMVNRILEEFEQGHQEPANFWIRMDDKYIHIAYYPVQNEQHEYLGCLEVTQNIAPLQAIRGEKRLL